MRQRRRESKADNPNSPKVYRSVGILAYLQMKPVISPTHKRTEGRAPVWGSEFTTKAATLQRDSADFAARLNVKFWDSVLVVVPGGCRELPLFWNSRAHTNSKFC
jgi:hypothetical protein